MTGEVASRRARQATPAARPSLSECSEAHVRFEEEVFEDLAAAKRRAGRDADPATVALEFLSVFCHVHELSESELTDLVLSAAEIVSDRNYMQ